MELGEIIKQAVLKGLENLDLNKPFSLSKRDHGALSFLYENGFIDDSSIEHALEVAVLRRAQNDYNHIVYGKSYPPDHAVRPECLAYAIQKGVVLTEAQVRKIPFDHGDSVETFCQTYGKENLLAKLRHELLNPKPLHTILDSDFDEHPACCFGFP